MTYNDLVTFGDVIPLTMKLDPKRLQQEMRGYQMSQYNSNKISIDRKGISITYNKKVPNYDLESLLEISKVTGSVYRDIDFKDKTEFWFKSHEIKKVVQTLEPYMCRSHILEMGPGGYFPPHRDPYIPEHNCETLRIFVPIFKCNPPFMYFAIDEEVRHWEEGRAYFINTNKMHHLFAYDGGSQFVIFNIEVNEKSLNELFKYFHKR